MQGAAFNPKSYRHYGDLYEVADDEFISEPDGMQMRQLHLDAQVNNGVQFNDDYAKWPDFSHAVFDNTSAYMPFRLLFHDFRPLVSHRNSPSFPCIYRDLLFLFLKRYPLNAGCAHRFPN